MSKPDQHEDENAPESTVAGGLDLSEYESRDKRLPFVLSRVELKLLGIAGVGFFLDAYDLFIINQVATMLQYRLYGGKALPAGLQGFVKASANIGAFIGQFLFGYLADAIGRKNVYGKELIVIIFGTILSLSAPTNDISPNSVLIWIGVWRIVQGIGIGGDYPMSATVMTDRARVSNRGALLAYIFANQGWGSFVGSIVTMVVLAAYKHVMNDEGKTSKVDGVWRIIIGISLIPAFATLYQRLVLKEAKRYVKSKESSATSTVVEKGATESDGENGSKIEKEADPSAAEAGVAKALVKKKAHWQEFWIYMSEWRHAKILIGTTVSWFLLDIAFYGINLNTNVVLQEIGFGGQTGTAWNKLFEVATGSLIITALGFVPGYYVTVLTVEYIGRKPIQIMGFIMTAFFLAILAGLFHKLSQAAFVVNFALLQFFFNFGANSTTFLYPAEVFPTRFRATAHGMSAACGKAGAIISSLAFNQLSQSIGTPNVLWIFFGCSILGVFSTLLLPEVKGRDPDAIYLQELAEAKNVQ